jgi:hypothetical protein
MFNFDPPNGESVLIGTCLTEYGEQGVGAQLYVHSTDEVETAERWQADLSAGGLPENVEDIP